MNLTTRDIDQLIREPSAKVRAGVAEKITRDFNEGRFSSSECELAFDIFRMLLKDVEVRVRRVLAETLHSNLAVPHDIVLRLANDVAEVSVPVLEHSYVLSEEDLAAIVSSTKAVAKLEAIARRASISRTLSTALLSTKNEQVIRTVFANKCASLDEEEAFETLKKMQHDNDLLETLIYRGGLSLAFVEKLFTVVSNEMRDYLTHQYKLPSKVADDAVDSAREWATLGSINGQSKPEDVAAMVQQLHEAEKLTHSIVLRSLCIGDMRFFEASMACLAGIPLINACLLMFDSGPLGFKAMYEASGLPEGFFEAVRTLHQIALEETGWCQFTREDYRKRIIQRLIAEGYDKKVENMSYLITIIGNVYNGQALH